MRVNVRMEAAWIGEDGAGVDGDDVRPSRRADTAVGNVTDVKVVTGATALLDGLLRVCDVAAAVLFVVAFLLLALFVRGDALGDVEFGTDNCFVVAQRDDACAVLLVVAVLSVDFVGVTLFRRTSVGDAVLDMLRGEDAPDDDADDDEDVDVPDAGAAAPATRRALETEMEKGDDMDGARGMMCGVTRCSEHGVFHEESHRYILFTCRMTSHMLGRFTE